MQTWSKHAPQEGQVAARTLAQAGLCMSKRLGKDEGPRSAGRESDRNPCFRVSVGAATRRSPHRAARHQETFQVQHRCRERGQAGRCGAPASDGATDPRHRGPRGRQPAPQRARCWALGRRPGMAAWRAPPSAPPACPSPSASRLRHPTLPRRQAYTRACFSRRLASPIPGNI